MSRKKIEIDPRIGNDRVGLMIRRGQVEHLGHAALKAQMMVDNGANVIGFGSSQKSGVYDNPLTSDQKRRAQLGAWGEAFKMVFLQDIGATDRSGDWADYVFDHIATNQLPEPTDLYAGSRHEARWYERHFASLDGECSCTRGMFKVWENPETGKRIHILDRNLHVPISSTEVRSMIERRDSVWRNFVPQKLWDFYEWEYPPELRAAIELEPGEDFPEGELPVGTKAARRDGPGEIFVLRDDGKWRPRAGTELAAKSLGD
jgi:hypothetical protein